MHSVRQLRIVLTAQECRAAGGLISEERGAGVSGDIKFQMFEPSL